MSNTTNTTADHRSLYEVTGDIKDINTLLVPRAALAALVAASQPVAAPSGPLTDSQIADIYFEALGSQHLREQDRKMVMRFARAIEANHGIKATNQESNK